MSCGGGLGPIGLSAIGGLMGGAGIMSAIPGASNLMAGAGGGMLSSAMGAVSKVAGGVIPGALNVGGLASAASGLGITDFAGNAIGPLTGITSAVSGSLGSIGSSFEQGLGAFTGSLGDGFSSIGGSGFVDGLTSHGANLFGSGPLQMAQSFNLTESFSSISNSLAGPLNNALGASFGANVSALTKVLPTGGAFGNFLGASIPDMQGLVTNGFSSLTDVVGNLPNLGADLQGLGTAFNVQDIANFGNPGQLVNSVFNAGGLGVTGIGDALSQVGVDPSNLMNLASGQFNDVIGDALNTITDPQLISNAQNLLGSSVQGLTSLGDFTDFAKVMPASFNDIPFDSFDNFREGLAGVELGAISTPFDLGGVINAVSPAALQTISNVTKVANGNALANIAETYIGGSGNFGAIQVGDMLGSVGGQKINTLARQFTNGMDSLDTGGHLTALKARYNEMSTAIGSTTYMDTSDTTTATTLTDPNGGMVHESLDSFIGDKIAQISNEVNILKNNSSISGLVANVESSYQQMQKKVFDEQSFATKANLQADLDIRDESKNNAFYFIDSIVDRVRDADKTDIISGMATAAIDNYGQVDGEYMRALVAESQNKILFEPHDIRIRAEIETEVA